MNKLEKIELEDRVEYRLHGSLHREDGPAIEKPNGDKNWYKNGKRHRESGPAIEWPNGYKAWFIEGKKLTEEEFNNHPLVKNYQKESRNETKN